MMMMQLELTGEVPFREVYIHALVRDEKGKKMSKSLGNILDPIELIDKYGADAVRFTLTAMAAMGRDLKLSEERIAGYRNFGTKLWNAARFAEMNDCRPDPAFDPTAVTLTANKWIVGETGRLREALDAALDGLPVQRCRERALRPRLGQGLRLVRGAGEAALRRRGRGGDPRHHGLGSRPVPDPDAPGDAVHHRGALGRDRRPRRSSSATPTGPATGRSSSIRRRTPR